VGGQRHALDALPPGKTRYDCVGDWVSPRAGLRWVRKSRPHRDAIPGPSKPVTRRYTDYAIPAQDKEILGSKS
jgi:hypothetical protein